MRYNIFLIIGLGLLTRPNQVLPTEELKMGGETLPHSIAMFSSKMFTSLVSQKELSGNLAVSPFLTHLSLSALHLGSKGKTNEDFNKVLGNWTEPCQDNGMGCPYRRLLKKLNEKSKAYNLNIASRPYIGEEPDPKYQKKLKGLLETEAKQVDFKKNRKGARKEINKWVEDQTNGRIKNFVNMKMLRSSTVLVAVAALYFHGEWKFPFDEKRTRKKVFNIDEGTKKMVEMMSMREPIRTLLITWQELDARVLKLPYEGNRTSMIFILPEEKFNLKNTETKMQKFGIKNMLASLDTLSAAKNFSEITKVKVQIPKFKMSKRLRLNGPLKELGMKNMFSSRADFTNMLKNKKTSKVRVSEVFQKINVIVNEKGSEVAAAGAAVATLFKSAAHTVKFVCDEPFLFVLRDDETGTVLLMGKVRDPTKT